MTEDGPVRPVVFIVPGFVLILILALLDYAAGHVFGFAVVFLLPVGLVTWSGGRWLGVTAAALSALAWSLADILGASQSPGAAVFLWSGTMRLGVLLGGAYLLFELKSSSERRAELARIDPLTSVANLPAFIDAAEREVLRSQRYSRPLTMAYVDLDNFRAVNARIGREGGDELLRRLAEAARAGLRTTDTVARVGGDEFAVLLPETGREAAVEVLSRLRHKLLEAAKESGTAVTVSIGAATFMLPPEDIEEMIRRSDVLMHKAKVFGKDGIQHAVFEGEKVAKSA